jgi:transcriptional regulator with XRE-family HTH domain
MTIREWREARSATQKQVADELGLATSVYQRIEAGQQEPTFEQMRRLRALSNDIITPDKLVGKAA